MNRFISLLCACMLLLLSVDAMELGSKERSTATNAAASLAAVGVAAFAASEMSKSQRKAWKKQQKKALLRENTGIEAPGERRSRLAAERRAAECTVRDMLRSAAADQREAEAKGSKIASDLAVTARKDAEIAKAAKKADKVAQRAKEAQIARQGEERRQVPHQSPSLQFDTIHSFRCAGCAQDLPLVFAFEREARSSFKGEVGSNGELRSYISWTAAPLL